MDDIDLLIGDISNINFTANSLNFEVFYEGEYYTVDIKHGKKACPGEPTE